MKIFVSIVVGVALVTGAAQAQTQESKEPQRDVLKTTPKENVMFESHVMSVGGAGTVEFVSSEASIPGKFVKGAPYSAEAVTETLQTLSDGNRISKKTSAATYRDAEGRTRRDMTLPAIGPWATAGEAPSLVFIDDPVAGISYHLDSKSKTARKLPNLAGGVSFAAATEGFPGVRVPAPGEAAGQVTAVRGAVMGIQAGGPHQQVHFQSRNGSEPKTEALGKQEIDGIQAEGSRTTITIPAGEIGNDREILIVSERWYSPELQTVVMSKHSDPRLGETVYRLENIKRSEPHPSLFQIPSDYKVVEEKAPFSIMRKIEKTEKE